MLWKSSKERRAYISGIKVPGFFDRLEIIAGGRRGRLLGLITLFNSVRFRGFATIFCGMWDCWEWSPDLHSGNQLGSNPRRSTIDNVKKGNMEKTVIIHGRKRKGVEIQCKCCGNSFFSRKDQLQKYCSLRCSRLSSRNSVVLNCAFCGRELFEVNLDLKTQKVVCIFVIENVRMLHKELRIILRNYILNTIKKGTMLNIDY